MADKEKVEDYIKNRNGRCPSCGGSNIEVEAALKKYNAENGVIARRMVRCIKCKEVWTEVFMLTDTKNV